MKKYIYGNFKMNLDIKQTNEYLEKFIPEVKAVKNEIALFMPYTNLMFAKNKCTSTNICIGAQNVSSEDKGAYTGEVSAQMLKDVCDKVIVGHSERRNIFGEKNQDANKKIKQCLANGLKVVYCIGENKNERVAGKTKQVISKQIMEGLKGLYENELKNVVIAYEPIWAIGTGESAPLKQVENATKIIRDEIKNEFSETAGEKIKILYGGSVKFANAQNYITIKGVDGLLVGGASLDAEEFAKICQIKV